MEKVTLKVDGMSCGHCVRSVEKALRSVDGVQLEQLAIGSATVSFDPTRTTIGALIDAVADAGYEAREAP
jgi:copper chaperone CopZ